MLILSRSREVISAVGKEKEKENKKSVGFNPPGGLGERVGGLGQGVGVRGQGGGAVRVGAEILEICSV